MSKQPIEGLPTFNARDLESEKQWGDYERKYFSRWEQHPVMHCVETDRNLTPTTSRMTKGTDATGTRTGDAPAKQPMAGMNVVPSEQRQVTPIRTDTELHIEPQGPGRRGSTFAEKFRQSREEIIAGCRYCGRQTSGERLSERERKLG